MNGTTKYSSYVTANWPWPLTSPTVKVTINDVTTDATTPVQAPWPFPKSKPEQVLGKQAFTLDDAEFSPAVMTSNKKPQSVRTLTEELRLQGVMFCHVIDHGNEKFHGMTIAYRKCSEWKNAMMVEVAVVYCSQHDNFSKKRGCALAAERFNDGRTILVPARTHHSDDTIPENLKEMFWYTTLG